MPFEARALRVQLPCKEVTVIDAEEHDARLEAHKYWRAVTLAVGGGVQWKGKCEECSANPSEPLCDNFSEDPDILSVLDHRVLPILRRQLERRLEEIAEAEAAVARVTGGG